MSILPNISVIIPVYNVEKYIHSCVDSVLKQTFQNFEIILVDDGSTDSCPGICDEYAAYDSKIKVIHKSNAGPSAARNLGLEVARGEYVCFLDSDDYIERNTLEYCLSLAKKENADEVRFIFSRFKSGILHKPKMLKVTPSYVVDDSKYKLQPLMAAIAPLLSTPILLAPSDASSCTAIYKRDLIEKNKIRFYSQREVKSEDYIFNIDFGMVCKRIVYTDNKFYRYRHNPKSISRSIRFDRLEQAIRFSQFLAKKLKGYGFSNSDVYSMGYTIGAMREQNRNIFSSNLPWGEKKMAFLKILDNEYIKEIQCKYPIEQLPKMQQVAFKLHINKQFLLSYIITNLRDIWKD